MFLKISRISQKPPVLYSLFNKVAGLQDNYIKKRIQHRCFPVNIAKFLGIPILKNICVRLLLVFCKIALLDQKFCHILTGTKRLRSNLMHFLKKSLRFLRRKQKHRAQVFYKKGYSENIIKIQSEKGNTCARASF